jgi:hypothetical protein
LIFSFSVQRSASSPVASAAPKQSAAGAVNAGAGGAGGGGADQRQSILRDQMAVLQEASRPPDSPWKGGYKGVRERLAVRKALQSLRIVYWI